jgi:tetratricopeptide (TPR) repeat protein
MWGYTARQVEKMLSMDSAALRAIVRTGVVEPTRGPQRELRFSFQDLVLLRTAHGLRQANVSAAKIRRAISKLRARLGAEASLSGLQIAVYGDELVVRDSQGAWDPDSGQAVFDFEVREIAARVAPLVDDALRERRDQAQLSAEDWYRWGCEVEPVAVEQALESYRQALTIDPGHAQAHVNLGRLLHERGDLDGALAHYQQALAIDAQDPTAAFNLGVVQQDRGNLPAAIEAYQRALTLDASSADSHFNLAGLYERLGRKTEALRHMLEYRRLRRASSGGG